jgi:hypothetical protein
VGEIVGFVVGELVGGAIKKALPADDVLSTLAPDSPI